MFSGTVTQGVALRGYASTGWGILTPARWSFWKPRQVKTTGGCIAVTDVAPVPDSPGYYVTTEGDVLSYWRPHGRGPYRIRTDLPAKTLTPRKHSGGYLRVSLGAGADRYIHRLVVQSFRGPIPPGMQVRHLDGDRTNNRLENLKVGTPSENESDKLRHGTRPVGENHVNSRLTTEQVEQARYSWAEGYDLEHIIEMHGISASRSSVHNAVIGKTWTSAPGPVGFRGRLTWRSKATKKGSK